MKINLTFWVTRPFPTGCDAYAPCANSLRPAIEALNGRPDPTDRWAILPGGHILHPFYADIDHADAKAVSRLIGGISRGHLTFGVDQGNNREIIVAKLNRSQVNSRNIELMIREVLKLRPHPDGGFLYNPDFGLVKIGKKNDDPGGSLIALNPLGRAEPQLSFDSAGMKGLLDALKFGGLLALGLLLFDKTKNEKSANF